MHDTVIRGGTIIDGTGGAAFSGDVAIEGGKLAQVGGKAGPGKREIDADGLLVTPGWVDAHTHYDGQATWDSARSLSLMPRLRSAARISTAGSGARTRCTQCRLLILTANMPPSARRRRFSKARAVEGEIASHAAEAGQLRIVSGGFL